MILNNDQVKLIADRGRTLPDAVLAPLVLAAVIGAAMMTEPVSVLPSIPAPQHPPEAPRGAYLGAEKRADKVVEFVAANPGTSCAAIARGLNCHANTVRDAIKRAGDRLQRQGTGNDTKYYPAAQPVTALQPAVLLTEQRIDGQNKQRLVRVERRKGVGRPVQPTNTKQRVIALVEYVRTHPGAQRGDFLRDLGWALGDLQYATKVARESGELRMEGEKAGAKYYVHAYVNGAASVKAEAAA